MVKPVVTNDILLNRKLWCNRSILEMSMNPICTGNHTVREVLIKNRKRVLRNVYNSASA